MLSSFSSKMPLCFCNLERETILINLPAHRNGMNRGVFQFLIANAAEFLQSRGTSGFYNFPRVFPRDEKGYVPVSSLDFR